MNEIFPDYLLPCVSDRRNSVESEWLQPPPEYGEYFALPDYPHVTPVYNGKHLDISPEFVHASLSGISIKHYHGKCYKEEEEEEREGEYEDAALCEDWLDYKLPNETPTATKYNKSEPSTESGSFEYRDSFAPEEGQPLCTLPKINHRNSFWNIHKPELCKLTWKQNYVGTSLVVEHLHEHLIHHGALCKGFHTEKDRECMLNKELDEYVRLKVLADPRTLPPDEPLFNFKQLPRKKSNHPKCKTRPRPRTTTPLDDQRTVQLSDEEDEMRDKIVRRSKEEFCLTIGKHIRKPPIVRSEIFLPGEESSVELPIGEEEEEVYGKFFYNWYLYCEEDYDQPDTRDTTLNDSLTITLSDSGNVDPCPPLPMDEFCRAAGKADFSDIRCDPDF